MSSISRLVDENGCDVVGETDINNELHKYYKNLYSNRSTTTDIEIANKLNGLDLKSLNENEKATCQAPLSERELFDALNEMNADPSPGNGGLTGEF